MRSIQNFTIENIDAIKLQLLLWAQQFNEVCLLDSNNSLDKYSSFTFLLGVDAKSSLHATSKDNFDALAQYRSQTEDFILGFLGYDLKNELEDLQSNNHDELDFPDLFFFQPKKLFLIHENILSFHYLPEVAHEIKTDWQSIKSTKTAQKSDKKAENLKVKLRIHKDDYHARVTKMLDHIHRGDIYEANFCQEFYANGKINPVATFRHLNAISLAPFASFFKFDDNYLLCSSPERYLKKVGDKIISQPIKGTAPRSENKEEDSAFAKALEADPKERTENIMITDLVRNDLSRTALKGSVQVEELCGVYSFKQVHQMISTITSQVPENIDPVEILETTFPMGSMTGAPKLSAMQIIEELEVSKRGLYSGSVGYFTPQGDFDFNVVIRSILYNAQKNYISFSVGSAITAQSIPEKEYEECLLKAKAMREVLE
ncbi:aminodeoxychorismate synthase component I [Leeuwenhoekiella sp. A16]|uniref:aminodeoxychorismate synthase component I n=1 Tax=unclassified Leeuwenhoekiella TaxID=2615029 RepID=UPI003A7F825E|tara:strand:+ start:20525 stop:21814 length:1290 start_codon:yes stop_codon:yes gene_type:complete